jgi:tRNA pseudouridine38-40 synthase
MTTERTIKLTIEYDGTAYAGWQVQPDVSTVQGEIEAAIKRVTGSFTRLIGAGRTDAGVHAAGQVAHGNIVSDMTPDRLCRALNGVMPRDITIVEAAEVPADFSARFDATSRTYRYTISRRRLAIGRAYAWESPYRLEIGKLEAATVPLIGTCNLRGFSKGEDDDDYDTIIFRNSWTENEHLLTFEISGIRFFHHAVRSIVGTAVDSARGRTELDRIARVLMDRDRNLAGSTAPAKGLCLYSISYGSLNVHPEDQHDIA